jgi:hypothetical protein
MSTKAEKNAWIVNGRRKIKKYPVEVEAAWFVLRPFIEVFDCNVKGPNGTYPMNKSEKLLDFFNKKILENKLSYFSKSKLMQHLQDPKKVYYHRSRIGSPYSTGWGVSDQKARELPFSADLGITTRLHKSETEFVLLLGIDIDAHEGQTDCLAVKDWVLTIFPGCYWEPSTNGRGIHIYLKVKYSCIDGISVYKTVSYIKHLCKQISDDLEVFRKSLGYQSNIDKIRSFPTEFIYDSNGQLERLSRSPVIKLPRFNQTQNVCNLNDIKSFYYSRYYGIQDLETVNEYIDSNICHLVNTEADKTIAQESAISEQKFQESPNNLYKSRQEADSSVYTHRIGGRLEEVVEELRNDGDAWNRSRVFYSEYARALNYVPDADQAIDEYERLGLSTGDRTAERIKRFQRIHDFIVVAFKPLLKKPFDFSGFEQQQTVICKFLESRLQPEDLIYHDGKRRYLKIARLALALFAMMKSQSADGTDRTEFGRNSLEKAFRHYKLKIHPNEAAEIFKLFERLGLIQLFSNYCPKKKFRTYRVIPISFLPDKAA